MHHFFFVTYTIKHQHYLLHNYPFTHFSKTISLCCAYQPYPQMSSSSYHPPSPAHPPSRVTPVITLPANPSTRNKWRSNQCVTIGCKSANQLVVTSRQSRSTPGIYTEVYLKQNTSYRIAVTGQALRHAKAFVFVYDPSTKCRLIPNYTMLSNTSLCTVSAEFCTPHCANDYVRLWLGVLFTGPPCNGQQFCLKTMRIQGYCGSMDGRRRGERA